MGDGQLRVRVRAYQREQAWQPDYVAPELSGTMQAAQRYHATAELRTAEARNESDLDRRAQLEREAADARALAQLLDERTTQLEGVDEIRARWYAHTAATRAAEQRARAELAARGVDPDRHDDTTTAGSWLAAQRAEQATEDPHRRITDNIELADVAEARDADRRAVEPEPSVDAAETNVADIRDKVADEPKRAALGEDDWTRVPSAGETAGSVARAQRALAELEQRRQTDQQREVEEARAQQLARWHRDDQVAAQRAEHVDERQLDRGAN